MSAPSSSARGSLLQHPLSATTLADTLSRLTWQTKPYCAPTATRRSPTSSSAPPARQSRELPSGRLSMVRKLTHRDLVDTARSNTRRCAASPTRSSPGKADPRRPEVGLGAAQARVPLSPAKGALHCAHRLWPLHDRQLAVVQTPRRRHLAPLPSILPPRRLARGPPLHARAPNPPERDPLHTR